MVGRVVTWVSCLFMLCIIRLILEGEVIAAFLQSFLVYCFVILRFIVVRWKFGKSFVNGFRDLIQNMFGIVRFFVNIHRCVAWFVVWLV